MIALLPVMLAAPVLQAELVSPKATHEQQLQQALTQMLDAADAQDTDRFMEWYWHSPELLLAFNGRTIRGWEANRDQQRKWWSTPQPGARYSNLQPPEVTMLSESLATSMQWLSFNGTKPSRIVVMSVWRRLPGGWRIIQAHESAAR